MIIKASWGLMEKLGNSFTGQDKLMEKDILMCLMKWKNRLDTSTSIQELGARRSHQQRERKTKKKLKQSQQCKH